MYLWSGGKDVIYSQHSLIFNSAINPHTMLILVCDACQLLTYIELTEEFGAFGSRGLETEALTATKNRGKLNFQPLDTPPNNPSVSQRER